MVTKKKQKVSIIGLGYVGFPLAVLCSLKGYEVVGYDTDTKKTKRIQKGENIVDEKYLDEMIPKAKIRIIKNEKELKDCDIHIIGVPTPVDKKHYPDLSYVVAATEMVARNAKKGSLVLVESTINPGVCEEIIRPIFERAGKKVSRDVYIAHCPERINPGDKKWNVTNIPRVVGSFDKTGLKKAVEFYEDIIDAEIMPMRTIREAEAVKIMENSFRDVNIAFVNELARSFDLLDIDVVNVIRGAATKPFAFMPHWPGCGVGGHCIPVDPYYLIEKAKENDFDHVFLRIARNINAGMAYYTVELLQDTLNSVKLPLKGTSVGVLGLSYKANVGDLRESPALKIIELIKDTGAKVQTFDPFLPKLSSAKSIQELLKKSKALVLTVNHSQFVNIPANDFKKDNIKVIIDGKNCLDKEKIKRAGVVYKGIGR